MNKLFISRLGLTLKSFFVILLIQMIRSEEKCLKTRIDTKLHSKENWIFEHFIGKNERLIQKMCRNPLKYIQMFLDLYERRGLDVGHIEDNVIMDAILQYWSQKTILINAFARNLPSNQHFSAKGLVWDTIFLFNNKQIYT